MDLFAEAEIEALAFDTQGLEYETEALASKDMAVLETELEILTTFLNDEQVFDPYQREWFAGETSAEIDPASSEWLAAFMAVGNESYASINGNLVDSQVTEKSTVLLTEEDDIEVDVVIDEIFVDGSRDTSDDDDDDESWRDDEEGDNGFDGDDGDDVEDGSDEESDVENLSPELAEQLGNAIGLLADIIDAASTVALPGDKAKLEALAQSLRAIQLGLAAGQVVSADTVINALGDAYSIALNEVSNWAVTAITTSIASMAGPHSAAVTAVMTSFVTFMADATGLTQEFYDRAGDILAEITYNAIMGLMDIGDSIEALQDAIESGIQEFVNDPNGTVSSVIGIPLLPRISPFGPNSGDEEFEHYQ